MGQTDAVMRAMPENDNVFIDLSVIKEIDGSPVSRLFWEDDLQMTIDKNTIIDFFNAKKIEMMPGQLRKIRNFPSKIVTFVKMNKCPGWFTMKVPEGELICE